MISLVSKRVPDVVVVLYALWTVTCHCVVVSQGTTYTLVKAASILLGGIIGVACAWILITIGNQRASLVSRRTNPDASQLIAVSSELDRRTHLTIIVLSTLLLGMWFVFRNAIAQWVGTCVYLLCCYILIVNRPIYKDQPKALASSRFQEVGLWVLVVAGGFLALFSHRRRNDDCYYINMAVNTADMPELPLLSVSNVHGPIDGVFQNIFIPYKVHSFEALAGLLSFVTGIEAIEIMHLWFAGFFALLIPLAFARLYRVLDSDRWFWMLVATFAFFIFEGSSGLGYSNHAFVRSFTGKSVMLSFGLPMLIAHGILFGLQPSWKRFTMLLCAQVTCLGLTSTSLWMAPIAAFLSTVVPLRFNKKALRIVGWMLLSCLYVLGAAIWIKIQLFQSNSLSAMEAVTHLPRTHVYLRMGLIYSAFKRIFMNPTVIQTFLSLVVASIAVARTSLSRRYVVVFCLALAVLLMNPYLADILRYSVFGRFTGQRTMWLLPVPAAVSICAVAFIPSNRNRWKRSIGITAMIGALSVLLLLVPTQPVFNFKKHNSYHWPPRLKVPRREFNVVKRLASLLPTGAHVLAPEKVSLYIPTIHHHPIPLLTKTKYFSSTVRDKGARKEMVKWVSKKVGEMDREQRRKFREKLNHYNIAAIVVNRHGAQNKGLKRAIRNAGFKWYRRSPPVLRMYLRKHLHH